MIFHNFSKISMRSPVFSGANVAVGCEVAVGGSGVCVDVGCGVDVGGMGVNVTVAVCVNVDAGLPKGGIIPFTAWHERLTARMASRRTNRFKCVIGLSPVKNLPIYIYSATRTETKRVILI